LLCFGLNSRFNVALQIAIIELVHADEVCLAPPPLIAVEILLFSLGTSNVMPVLLTPGLPVACGRDDRINVMITLLPAIVLSVCGDFDVAGGGIAIISSLGYRTG
jgi:hypothetical protein